MDLVMIASSSGVISFTCKNLLTSIDGPQRFMASRTYFSTAMPRIRSQLERSYRNMLLLFLELTETAPVSTDVVWPPIALCQLEFLDISATDLLSLIFEINNELVSYNRSVAHGAMEYKVVCVSDRSQLSSWEASYLQQLSTHKYNLSRRGSIG